MKKRILGLALAMLLLFCAAALGETNTQVKHYLMLGEDGYADQEYTTDWKQIITVKAD